MRYAIVFLLFPAIAMAQTAPPKGTPLEEALSQELGQKASEAIYWHAQAITAQREIEAAKALQKKLDAEPSPQGKTP